MRKSIGLGALTLFPYYGTFGKDKLVADKDPLDKTLVEEFVRVAHFDLIKVKELLNETPNLINVAWDWKNGDFETAIGAAGHMGLKDVATYLIEKGARFDLFVLSMLGKTNIVKPLIECYPQQLNAIGPHGFTLLHHAKQGGEDAAELFDYFQSQGLKETFIKTF